MTRSFGIEVPRFVLSALVAAGCSLAAFSVAGTASADPLLPGFLHDNGYTPCVPDCTLCHINETGGLGTLHNGTGVGGKLIRYGFGGTLEYGPPPPAPSFAHTLDPYTPSGWGPALTSDEQYNNGAGYDTDGDGYPDLEELKAASDPADVNSHPGVGASICPDLKYGCANRVARKGSVDGLASLASGAVLVIGLGLVRRRKQR